MMPVHLFAELATAARTGAAMNLHSRDITAEASATHVAHWDIESRAVLRLDKVGSWKYAADPGTEIICIAFATDDQPVKTLVAGRSYSVGIPRDRTE